MAHRGFSHIGLSTLDLDKTRAFYQDVLGFKMVAADIIKIKEGGQIRHIFFDVGHDQLLAFMEPQGIPDIPAVFDAGINRGLDLPAAFYHFAFEAGSLENLQTLKASLEAHGVAVRGVEDHEGWCRSIYFTDPNGLQLEYCCLSRTLTDDDARPQVRFRVSREGKKLPA